MNLKEEVLVDWLAGFWEGMDEALCSDGLWLFSSAVNCLSENSIPYFHPLLLDAQMSCAEIHSAPYKMQII